MDGTRNHRSSKVFRKVTRAWKPENLLFARGSVIFALIKQLNDERTSRRKKIVLAFCSPKQSDLFCRLYQSFSLQLTPTKVHQTFCFVMTFEASKAGPKFNNQKVGGRSVVMWKVGRKFWKYFRDRIERQTNFLPPPNPVWLFFTPENFPGSWEIHLKIFLLGLKLSVWRNCGPGTYVTKAIIFRSDNLSLVSSLLVNHKALFLGSCLFLLSLSVVYDVETNFVALRWLMRSQCDWNETETARIRDHLVVVRDNLATLLFDQMTRRDNRFGWWSNQLAP